VDLTTLPGGLRHAWGSRSRALGVACLTALGVLLWAATFVPELGVDAPLLFIPLYLLAGWYFGLEAALVAWGASVALLVGTSAFARGAPPSPVELAAGLVAAVGFGAMRRAQVKQEESEERFRRLAEASFEGIVIHEQGRILDCNEVFARMFGHEREDLLGHDTRAQPLVVTPQGEGAFSAAEGPARGALEAVGRRKDGSSFEVEILSRPLTHEGRPAHVASVRDVTEAKRTREALQRSERLSALGTLVAGVAHEINNPLAYVRGNVELLEMTTAELSASAPSEEARSRVLEMQRETRVALEGLDRIAAITRSLKQIARVGPQPRAPTDVNALVANVLNVAAPRVPDGVKLESELRATRLVLANGSEIAQVLINLVFNAADATEAKGSRVVIRSRDEPGRVVVEVEDDGVGIPAQERAKLFTPFFTTKPQGTGLGLSVSQSIATDHGGALTFTSREGEGTIFRLALPAAVSA